MYATGSKSCYSVSVTEAINLLSSFDTTNKDPPPPPLPPALVNLHLAEKPCDSKESDDESGTSEEQDWSLVVEEVDDRLAVMAAAIAAPASDDYHLDSKEDDFVDCEGIYEDDEIEAILCMVQAEEEG